MTLLSSSGHQCCTFLFFRTPVTFVYQPSRPGRDHRTNILAGTRPGKTQLAGRKPPALNKSQFLHRHTQPHTGMASFPSLCLCSAQEVSSPSALIRRVCMQALVMHVITLCGVFICLRFFPRRRERARSPASCAVCSEEEHAFLKLNPEHTALPCSFPDD